MSYTLIVFIIFIAAFFLMNYFMKRKNKKEFDNRISRLEPGVHIVAVNGLRGVVTAVTEDSVRVDMSPDESGSVIEISKEAVRSVMD